MGASETTTLNGHANGTIKSPTGDAKPPPFQLTALDIETLSMTDEDFKPDDWERLKEIVAANDLDAFRRYPSELRAYIAWTHKTKAQYKNMTNYLCQKRLQWDPRPPELGGSTFEYRNSVPYADERDFKVLFNDWPYGFTPDIKHLVCWSKTPVAAKPETGEITDESRAIIEAFVDRYFCKRLREKYGSSENRIVWFKNWTKLQSVRAIEHFHVLVRDVDKELLAEWTNGDERDLSVLKLES